MNKKAYTIAEMMVVVVIMGIMAAFAIPQFTGTVSRSAARDAITNLQMIHAANMLFRSRNGLNFDGVIADINDPALLGLNVIPNGMTYECGATNLCTATNGTVTVTLDLDSALSVGVNPACAPADSCP